MKRLLPASFIFALAVTVCTVAFFRSPSLSYAHQEDAGSEEQYLHIGGEGDDAALNQLQSTIQELQAKITQLKTEQRSLSGEISVFNNQILLKEKEIEKTEYEISLLERQIEDLSQRIDGLELSLKDLSKILLSRIRRQYKQSQADSVSLFFSSAGLTEFVKEQRYMQQTRAHTEDLMLASEYKRQVYDEEKQTKEEKHDQVEKLQATLEQQKATLNSRRKEKQTLLDQTKNNESEYQRLLTQALAESRAIESALVSGTKVGPIKQGEPIALVGNSGYPGCSTGAHLHFEVRKNNTWTDPAAYLKKKEVFDADRGATVAVGSDSGSWEWPLTSPIRLTQHYGHTPYSWRYKYSGGIHTGMDLTSSASDVIRAPADGTLYSSSEACGSSSVINIRYIDHGDGVISLYLHVK